MDGYAWETVWDIVSLVASAAEVAANPVDPWAWAGLLGDVVDVVIPCIGGLGEAVDAVKTAVKVVDKGDDIIDAAKQIHRMADASDPIKDAVGSYIVLYQKGQHYIGKGGFMRAITSATEHMSNSNKVSAIIRAPTSSSNSAFITEYLLQSTLGSVKKLNNSFNIYWSPGKRLFSLLQ